MSVSRLLFSFFRFLLPRELAPLIALGDDKREELLIIRPARLSFLPYELCKTRPSLRLCRSVYIFPAVCLSVLPACETVARCVCMYVCLPNRLFLCL